jgi:hypothetical protein
MLIAIIIGTIVGILVITFIIMKIILIFMLAVVCLVYFLTYLGLDSIFGPDKIAYSIFGTMLIGSLIIWLLSRLAGMSEDKKVYVKSNENQASPNSVCPCGSGKTFSKCHGLLNQQ